jgi:hypothetical protein
LKEGNHFENALRLMSAEAVFDGLIASSAEADT